MTVGVISPDRSAGGKVSRRDACKIGLAAAVSMVGGGPLGGLASSAANQHTGDTSKFMNSKPHIAVAGAGAFGGWTALHLLRGGARVTLLDAWGPGNSRASSGGETRVMRGAYGPNQPIPRWRRERWNSGTSTKQSGNRIFFIPSGCCGWWKPTESSNVAPCRR